MLVYYLRCQDAQMFQPPYGKVLPTSKQKTRVLCFVFVVSAGKPEAIFLLGRSSLMPA
jgi:hypothetical protein